MPVSGLVVSLHDDARLRAETLEMIRKEPRITVGLADGGRVAIVLDTTSGEQDREVWNWLHSLSGVALLEVAYVGFDQEQPVAADRPRRITEHFQSYDDSNG